MIKLASKSRSHSERFSNLSYRTTDDASFKLTVSLKVDNFDVHTCLRFQNTLSNLFSLTNHPTVLRRTSVYIYCSRRAKIISKNFTKERDEIVKRDDRKFNGAED
jgi:hypothetical protein